jgi:hypothetical protein
MSRYNRLEYSRFSAAPFVTKKPLEITLGGLGGVGAYVAFFLSRLRHELFCYEMDTVEDVNLDCQFFKYEDLGKPKASAVSDMIRQYSNGYLDHLGKYEEGCDVTPYCFAMFDNMEARKLMFEEWCNNKDSQIFIDTRLQAEEFQIFCVHKEKHIQMYLDSLRNDDEIPDLPCSYKQTGHYAAMVATQAVALFCNYLANQKHLADIGEEIREVPFFTTFNGLTWQQQ